MGEIGDPEFERREVEAAEREAAGIGGPAPDETNDPAQRAVQEGGGGESEGFEEAEQELIDHASHTDMKPARVILHDEMPAEEPDPTRADGEPDYEPSSESEEEGAPES